MGMVSVTIGGMVMAWYGGWFLGLGSAWRRSDIAMVLAWYRYGMRLVLVWRSYNIGTVLGWY